ncbi:hypothetical protein GCM10010298_30460 [Streptomyces microflavus]|uniref:Uncharacterized protein n=1 Tax=Streptomyces microflavus TaxID=1919 RepID=A0A7J0CYQ3_STRMI|nr:hypothetical protein Smic_61490 [Streptomyces microflavus]GGX63670.1 hypothetical protein GCM10010298_30460 [Streptomyces microflavus]
MRHRRLPGLRCHRLPVVRGRRLPGRLRPGLRGLRLLPVRRPASPRLPGLRLFRKCLLRQWLFRQWLFGLR